MVSTTNNGKTFNSFKTFIKIKKTPNILESTYSEEGQAKLWSEMGDADYIGSFEEFAEELDKNTTKLSDLDELDSVIEDFKKDTDERFEVDVQLDIINGSLDLKRIRKPYLKVVK